MTAGPGSIPNMSVLSPVAVKSASIKSSLKLMNKDQMMNLIKQSLSSGQADMNDIMQAAQEVGVDITTQKYYPGRNIDRKDVFRRIFKGENLTHEDMFKSRGYRGLNILPFPRHVRD